jgi:plasmid stabilization system protein ParE
MLGQGGSLLEGTRYDRGREVSPCLRSWPQTRYPHLVFSIERDNHIDVSRLLHGQRDIPQWFSAK